MPAGKRNGVEVAILHLLYHNGVKRRRIMTAERARKLFNLAAGRIRRAAPYKAMV